MIQRIQSLYLLLTSLLSILFLKGSIICFSDTTGASINLVFKGIIKEINNQSPEIIQRILPVSILILVIPLIALITIFLFKKRSIQLLLIRLMSGLVLAFIILLAVYSFNIIKDNNASVVPVFRMFIPVIQLILLILAYRGIKKDDDLVKSYDRLR